MIVFRWRVIPICISFNPETWKRDLGYTLAFFFAINLFIAVWNHYAAPKRRIRMLEEMENWRQRSAIDLPGCRLPYIDPDNVIIQRDWFEKIDTSCPHQLEFFFSTEIRDNRACLVIHRDILEKNFRTKVEGIQCKYSKVETNLSSDPWINVYTVGPENSLNLTQCFKDPLIWINCRLPYGRNYLQPLFVSIEVPPKHTLHKNQPKSNQKESPRQKLDSKSDTEAIKDGEISRTSSPDNKQTIAVENADDGTSINVNPAGQLPQGDVFDKGVESSLKNDPAEQDNDSDYPSGKPFNVLVLGVDAVSRAMFHRNMKGSRRTITEIYDRNAFELLGFNKVGENSAPNQIPMLTGKRFRHEIDMNHGEYFDDFATFVWQNFSQSGYTTFFAEEQMTYGLFNYPRRKGFRNIPTDYWPRPLTLARDKLRKMRGYQHSCLGNEHISTTLLNYWLQLQQISSSPTFSYIWLSEATHDSVSGSLLADDLIVKFFKQFSAAGLMSKTIVFLLADHGFRIGEYRKSPLGALEDLLPFGYILLPPKFRRTNPEDLRNLIVNTERLTTPYDIHATLVDLASRPRGFKVEATDLGISLLSSRISPERTCETAGIDPQYCGCYSHENLPLNSEKVPADFLASEIVDFVNRILETNNLTTTCLLFKNPEASDVVALGQMGNGKDFKFVKIGAKTSLRSVKFEAVFKVNHDDFELLGYPERLDRYDRYSSCVRDYFYEKFCYCA